MAPTRLHRLSASRRVLALAVAGAALLIVAWRWLAYLRGPDPVAREFVSAVERRDAARLLALSLDQEKREMGLTVAAVRRALDGMMFSRAAKVRGHPSRISDAHPMATNWYVKHVAWVDAATGKPLMPGANSGEHLTTIDLFQGADRRWRVSFSRFAAEWLVYNVFHPEFKKNPGLRRAEWTRARREAQFREWGLPPTYYDPAMVRQHGQFRALLDTTAYRPQVRADWKAAR